MDLNNNQPKIAITPPSPATSTPEKTPAKKKISAPVSPFVISQTPLRSKDDRDKIRKVAFKFQEEKLSQELMDANIELETLIELKGRYNDVLLTLGEVEAEKAKMEAKLLAEISRLDADLGKSRANLDNLIKEHVKLIEENAELKKNAKMETLEKPEKNLVSRLKKSETKAKRKSVQFNVNRKSIRKSVGTKLDSTKSELSFFNKKVFRRSQPQKEASELEVRKKAEELEQDRNFKARPVPNFPGFKHKDKPTKAYLLRCAKIRINMK